MKAYLFAAAALIAAPAFAQTTTPPAGGQSTTGQAGTPDSMQSGTMTDPAAPTASPTDPTTPTDQPTTAPPESSATDPSVTNQGGSMTTQDGSMAASGNGAMGTPVSPSTTGSMGASMGATGSMGGSMGAMSTPPAEAPLASYPVCKAGQYDDCIQASDARRAPRARSRRR